MSKEKHIIYREREPLQDHCGIVAAYSPEETYFFVRGLSGLYKEQTRGQTGAGVVRISHGGGVGVFQEQGMIEEAFDGEMVQSWSKRKALSWSFQTRYGTHGNNERQNIQPIIRRQRDTGEVFAIVHNGNFFNGERDGKWSDTVIFANMLANEPSGSWEEKIVAAQKTSLGAWSLAINTENAMYAMRDPYGIRPMVYGEYTDDLTGRLVYVIASETAALEVMGISYFYEVMPGSVVKFSGDGVENLLNPSEEMERAAPCSFENVYFQDPASALLAIRSSTEEINYAPKVADFRRRTGELLAMSEEEGFAKNVDLVVGIPGTGIVGGKAYAKELGVPYIQAIVDNNNGERTFILPNVDEIAEKVMDHFDLKSQFLKGLRVVLVDDSVVRGNISQGLVRLVRDGCGAIEVHLRSLYLPVDKPCYLGISTRKEEELIAARHDDTVGIAREIGADSIRYMTVEQIVDATGSEYLCVGCTVGNSPPIGPYSVGG